MAGLTMAAKKRRWPPHTTVPAEPGNLKAVKHGAQSRQLLAPLRQAFFDELRLDFPDADRRLLWMAASRFGRLKLAEDFLDERGIFKDEEAGEVYPVTDRVEKWSRRAEDLIRNAGVQQQAASPIDLAVAIAELAKGGG